MELSEALRSAFTPQRLREMLWYRLDKDIDNIGFGNDYREIVFKLIRVSQADNWITKLIIAARESNPDNPLLVKFCNGVGLSSLREFKDSLERVVVEANAFLDPMKWRSRLGQIEAQVCRVEIRVGVELIAGTGFLVAPNVIITNYHVMQPVIEKGIKGAFGKASNVFPSDVLFRFDYKTLEDGSTVNPGTMYTLASEDWLIDMSPDSPDELDYALLRIEGSPGLEPIGENPEPGAAVRHWIEIPKSSYDFFPDSTMLIMQHPKGGPLKLAIDTKAIIGFNPKRTRVMYRTNTEPGSSGSPCFNQNWDLIALHSGGDPDFSFGHMPSYNEGIPFSAIVSQIEQKGLISTLGWK